MTFKKKSIKFTFPDLSNVPQRGNISTRLEIAEKITREHNLNINFDLIEISADFVKTSK